MALPAPAITRIILSFERYSEGLSSALYAGDTVQKNVFIPLIALGLREF
jgi:hypothetical protein